MKKLLLTMFAAVLSMGAFAADNLLENGDFETWADGKPTNWATACTAGNATISQSTEAHAGSYSAQVATASSNKRMAYKETTLSAGTYTFSFWVRTADGSDAGKACIGYAPVTDGSVGQYSYLDSNGAAVTGEWAQFTYEFTLTETTTICPLLMVKKNTVDLLVDDASLTSTDGGTTDPEDPKTDISNTPETAYSVADAYKLIDAGEGLDTEVYVKGYIVGTPEVSTSYGNATYNISDVKGDETTVLVIFRGKYFEGASFTEENQDKIAEGDEVVVYGKLTLYGEKYEMNSGNYLYSINGRTSDDSGSGTDISNTEETAYTVAKAHEIIAAGEGLDTEVYVKGVVTSVSSFNSTYGSITYYLGDTQDDANPLQIYGGLYYNGDMFSSKDDLQVGDEIVVLGKLKSYNGTDEMDKNNVVISHKRDGVDVTPDQPKTDITNTPETAYSIADAIGIIDAGEGLTTKVYVKGYIVGTPSVSTSYGNAQYNISDVKDDETTTLTVYRGYYLNNEKFTSEDQINTGDEVVVYGNLTLYGTTYEMASGNYIYSLNGSTDGISSIEETKAQNAPVYNLAGQRVSESAKGLLIQNGKKFIRK